MDVQNSLNVFTRLNDLARRPGSTRGLNWVDALDAGQPSPAKTADAPQNQPTDRAFANLLDKAIEAKPAAEAPEESGKEKELRKWATTLVNKFFIGTMLKQMRDSPFKTEMFSGGKGGEAYQGMMDEHIAEHAGNRIAKSLVDSIVKSKSHSVGDPQKLYADPVQQKQLETYLKTQPKRASHESATSLSA